MFRRPVAELHGSRRSRLVGGFGEQPLGLLLVDATRLIARAWPVCGVDGDERPVEAGVAGGDVEVGVDEGQRGRRGRGRSGGR